MNNDFGEYFSDPKILANKVFEEYYSDSDPSFPIDPFKILTDMSVIYQFRGFKELEGLYIAPEDDDDIPTIGININRPITRQRFTAAHEMCHHIKDKNSLTCPIGYKNAVERYADTFASELLMPKRILRDVSNKYLNKGYIEFKYIIYISDYFGVSFEACVLRLAYDLRRISGNTDYKELKKRIRKFKPDTKRIELGLNIYSLDLMGQIIKSYKYLFKNDSLNVWYKFKNDFIYNENRIEGINLSIQEVSEILTDLRINKCRSEYCKSEYQDIIEVVGHASLYDYIQETDDDVRAFKLINLNKMLYQFAPFPEMAGKTRLTNNLVLCAKFETVDWHEVPNKLLELDKEIIELCNEKNNLSILEYINKVLEIHYKITVIHPFSDGNGRVSRVMLNWLFRIKDLPPVYLKFDEKENYYNALKLIDVEGDYSQLREVFYKEILRTMIQLNSKCCL